MTGCCCPDARLNRSNRNQKSRRQGRFPAFFSYIFNGSLRYLRAAADNGSRRLSPGDVNNMLSLIGMFAAKTQDLVVLDRYNLSNSTRVGWLYRWDELLSTTYFQCFTIVFLILSDQHPRHVFVFHKIHLLLPLLDQSNQLSYWPNQSSQDCYQDWRDRF